MLQKCVHLVEVGDIHPTKFNKVIMGKYPIIYMVLYTSQVVIGDEPSTVSSWVSPAIYPANVLQPGVPTSSRSGGDFRFRFCAMVANAQLHLLVGGFEYFLCSSLPGEMIQFD